MRGVHAQLNRSENPKDDQLNQANERKTMHKEIYKSIKTEFEQMFNELEVKPINNGEGPVHYHTSFIIKDNEAPTVEAIMDEFINPALSLLANLSDDDKTSSLDLIRPALSEKLGQHEVTIPGPNNQWELKSISYWQVSVGTTFIFILTLPEELKIRSCPVK